MTYRAFLFQDLLAVWGTRPAPRRVLEIGPRDGQDTWRTAIAWPQTQITLVDLPERELDSVIWLAQVTEYLQRQGGRLIYTPGDILTLPLQGRYDLIWCTGVLYHNKEQYAILKKLYEALNPNGVFVVETAVIRNPFLRWFNCVQVLWPFSQRVKQWYHLSARVTHLPSKKAIRSWMEMAGFREITLSTCHRRVSWRLAMNRVAYVGTK